MSVVDLGSLADVLDVVNEAWFQGRTLPKSRKERTARWIAGRQGLPGAYHETMFAPTDSDRNEGVRLFTGERLTTRAGTAHVLGEEACRALILLDAPSAHARDALGRATEGMSAVLRKAAASKRWRDNPGEYCCGTCSVSLWRHMAVGGLPDVDPQRWLSAGLRSLKAHRLGNGRWRRFPLHYTLLAISEIDLPGALKEMRYAAPVCERHLRRGPKDDEIDRRRRQLAERILAKC